MFRYLKTKTKRAILHSVLVYDRITRRHEDGFSPENWGMSSGPKGHLIIQGCDTVELAREYGTPLYVIDKTRLEKDYLYFYDTFKRHYSKIEIGYSYKTNPLPGIIKLLHGLGASAEVISPFELWLALKLKVPPERIIYNGPCKSEESLATAIAHKIKLINIDGPGEIEIIDKLTKRYGHSQQVGVRVITSVGWAAQFGFDIKTGAALRAFQRLSKLQNVIPCGLHIHLGTGIKKIHTYIQAIKEVLDFSMLLKSELGVRINYFDFGGGFGVPTTQNYTELDMKLLANDLPHQKKSSTTCPPLSDYSSAIMELFQEYYPDGQKDAPTIIFEPGRAITSSAQSLLLKVITTKPGKNGNTIAIVDGGMNIAMPTRWEYHELLSASKMNASPTKTYTICGPLCHPNDVLYKFKKLCPVEPGDILAIMDTGAYFVPNQMNFSFPRPAAIIVDSGRHQLIRERESFKDMIILDKFD